MNWIRELCDIYDKNEEYAGVVKEGCPILLPLFHTTVTAQITVTVDEDGNFIRAERVEPADKLTLIPVTEKSNSRTVNPAPHPLCDSLKYIAGDYGEYVHEKDYSENHRMYMEQLGAWVHSRHCHEKASAVYQYLDKECLMRDLCNAQVLKLDENGNLLQKETIQHIPQEGAFVRFRIEKAEIPGENMLKDESGRYFAECWKDRTLQESFIDFYREYGSAGEVFEEISYLTGNKGRISYLQPDKVRNEGDKAKLFSSNDGSNFTYRGRFNDKEEAVAIGYEDSQKLHNALKWIMRRQGTGYDSFYIVTWESDLRQLPDWKADSNTICREAEELDEDEWETEEPEYGGTGEAGAARFRRAIRGYESRLDQTSQTVIMAFDAATTGRLAMVECRDYQTSRYLRSLTAWYERCRWRFPQSSREKGRYVFYGMAGIRDVAELLYGTEQNGYFSMKGKEDRYKEVTMRLMPCILDGREAPADIVLQAVRRASNPVAFESRFLWERMLALACSLVRQQFLYRYKEDWTMALDEGCTKRDYLYGRLLALADRIEYRTYDKEENRETNAKRYMCAFSQHPFRTWKIVEEKLGPYLTALNKPERLKYQNMLDEICSRFSMKDFESDEALNGLYLLGFHNQSHALREKEEEKA